MLEGNLLIGRQVDYEERHAFFPEARGIKLEVVKYPEAKHGFLLLWRKWMGRPQPSWRPGWDVRPPRGHSLIVPIRWCPQLTG